MKKVLFKLMAIAVVFSLAACNNQTGKEDKDDQDSIQIESSGEKTTDYPSAGNDDEADNDSIVGGKAEKVEGDPEAIISRGKIVEEVEEEKKEERSRKVEEAESKEVKPDNNIEGVIERGKKVKEGEKKEEPVRRKR